MVCPSSRLILDTSFADSFSIYMYIFYFSAADTDFLLFCIQIDWLKNMCLCWYHFIFVVVLIGRMKIRFEFCTIPRYPLLVVHWKKKFCFIVTEDRDSQDRNNKDWAKYYPKAWSSSFGDALIKFYTLLFKGAFFLSFVKGCVVIH